MEKVSSGLQKKDLFPLELKKKTVFYRILLVVKNTKTKFKVNLHWCDQIVDRETSPISFTPRGSF